jgi:hypothetical protein
MCQASAGATVKHHPKPVSGINRNSVKDQVTPERQASPEPRHSLVGRVGIEPTTRGLKAPCSATELTARSDSRQERLTVRHSAQQSCSTKGCSGMLFRTYSPTDRAVVGDSAETARSLVQPG